VRNIRAEMNISTAIKFDLHVAGGIDAQKIFRATEPQILKLARATSLIIADQLNVPKASGRAVTNLASIAVPLEGLIDFDKERARLNGQIDKLSDERTRLEGQLSNANFVGRAPAEKVAELRERNLDLDKQIETLRLNLDSLS